MKYKSWKKNVGRTALAAMIALSLTGTGLAMPEGGKVLTGEAYVVPGSSGSGTYIANQALPEAETNWYSITPYSFTVIEWNKFNLKDVGEFFQGNTEIAPLVNIVNSQNGISSLNGQILQNGSHPMYIINPAGITVGADSSIYADNLVLSAMQYSGSGDYASLANGTDSWSGGGAVNFEGGDIKIGTGLSVYGTSIEIADGVTFSSRYLMEDTTVDYDVDKPNINFVAAYQFNGQSDNAPTDKVINFNGTINNADNVTFAGGTVNIEENASISAASKVDIAAFQSRSYKNDEADPYSMYNGSTKVSVASGSKIYGGTINIGAGDVDLAGTVSGRDINVNVFGSKSDGKCSYSKSDILNITKGANITSTTGNVSLIGGTANINGDTVVRGGTGLQISALGTNGDDVTGLTIDNGANISAGISGASVDISEYGDISLTGPKVSVGGSVTGAKVDINTLPLGVGYEDSYVYSYNTSDNVAEIQSTGSVTGNTSVAINAGKVNVAGTVNSNTIDIHAYKTATESDGETTYTYDDDSQIDITGKLLKTDETSVGDITIESKTVNTSGELTSNGFVSIYGQQANVGGKVSAKDVSLFVSADHNAMNISYGIDNKLTINTGAEIKAEQNAVLIGGTIEVDGEVKADTGTVDIESRSTTGSNEPIINLKSNANLSGYNVLMTSKNNSGDVNINGQVKGTGNAVEASGKNLTVGANAKITGTNASIVLGSNDKTDIQGTLMSTSDSTGATININSFGNTNVSGNVTSSSGLSIGASNKTTVSSKVSAQAGASIFGKDIELAQGSEVTGNTIRLTAADDGTLTIAGKTEAADNAILYGKTVKVESTGYVSGGTTAADENGVVINAPRKGNISVAGTVESKKNIKFNTSNLYNDLEIAGTVTGKNVTAKYVGNLTLAEGGKITATDDVDVSAYSPIQLLRDSQVYGGNSVEVTSYGSTVISEGYISNINGNVESLGDVNISSYYANMDIGGAIQGSNVYLNSYGYGDDNGVIGKVTINKDAQITAIANETENNSGIVNLMGYSVDLQGQLSGDTVSINAATGSKSTSGDYYYDARSVDNKLEIGSTGSVTGTSSVNLQGGAISVAGNIDGKDIDIHAFKNVTTTDDGEVITYEYTKDNAVNITGKITSDDGDISIKGNTLSTSGEITAENGDVKLSSQDKTTVGGKVTGGDVSIRAVNSSGGDTATSVIVNGEITATNSNGIVNIFGGAVDVEGTIRSYDASIVAGSIQNAQQNTKDNVVTVNGVVEADNVDLIGGKINMGGRITSDNVYANAYYSSERTDEGMVYTYNKDNDINITGTINKKTDNDGRVEILGHKVTVTATPSEVDGEITYNGGRIQGGNVDIEAGTKFNENTGALSWDDSNEISLGKGTLVKSANNGVTNLLSTKVGVAGTVEGGTVEIESIGDQLTVSGSIASNNSTYLVGDDIEIADGASVSSNKSVTLETTGKTTVAGEVIGNDVAITSHGSQLDITGTVGGTNNVTITGDGSTINITGKVHADNTDSVVKIKAGNVDINNAVTGSSVTIIAGSADAEGNIVSGENNKITLGDNASIRSTGTNSATTIQSGNEVDSSKVAGKANVNGTTYIDGTKEEEKKPEPTPTPKPDEEVTATSFEEGKKQAEEILAKDKDDAARRNDFRGLTQSINKSTAEQDKKHAMIAGIFAAVDELMKEGNENRTANICLDVLNEYDGTKGDVEASEDVLHREMEHLNHAVDEKIPQPDVVAEPELTDVTFSEG